MVPQGATVKSPDFIEDRVTRGEREVDVSVRMKVGSVDVLIILECRDRDIEDDPIGSFTYGYVGSMGRVSTVTYPNGQTTSYAYYPVAQDMRLQQIHHKKPGGVTLNTFDYTYDVAGNLLTWAQQTDNYPAQTYAFEYDRADQVTGATLSSSSPKRYRYAYDLAGNRTAEQIDDVVMGASHDNMNRLVSQSAGGALSLRGTLDEPATVMVGGAPAGSGSSQFSGSATVSEGASQVTVQATDPSGNMRTNTYEVTQTGTASTFTYDANGNLTSDGTKTYEWDAENRLLAVKQGGSPLATFTYAGSGRRSTKAAGGVTTSFVYDGQQFLEERPSAGTARRFVYGPAIDQPLAHVLAGVVSFYSADHLGSVVRTADSAGTPTLTREYDPWGNLLQGTATSGFAFTGREWDPEAGLYYYRARYYRADLGRFLSEDPLGLSAREHNLSVYVSGNPIIRTDPTGLIIRLSSNFTDTEQRRYQAAIDTIRTTSLGRTIVEALDKDQGRVVLISPDVTLPWGYDPKSGNIHINPSDLWLDELDRGWCLMTDTRHLAHELAHAYLRSPNEQLIVNFYENPITMELGQGRRLSRTRREIPPKGQW
jgi:RHS repeat-associated protein